MDIQAIPVTLSSFVSVLAEQPSETQLSLLEDCLTDPDWDILRCSYNGNRFVGSNRAVCGPARPVC